MSNVNIIHKWLKDQERMLDGKPVWRLIWSEAITEKRQGTFEDYYGNLFIREYIGVRECRKYNYIKDRWILEKFSPGNNSEIQNEGGGTYEPFFVFESAKREYLPPTIKVVEFIVGFARSRVVSTPQERRNLVERADDEEIKQFLGHLEDVGRSSIESLIHTGEGVSLFIPKKEIRFKEKRQR